MKKFKKIALTAAVILAVGATSVAALAATGHGSPAEFVAELTGRPLESVIAKKNEGDSTYGAIAAEAGFAEEFKARMLERKKAILAEQVAEGSITQEKADEIIAAVEANQANCDGSGSSGSGAGSGMGMGMSSGRRMGNGAGGGMKGNSMGGGAAGRNMGICVTEQ